MTKQIYFLFIALFATIKANSQYIDVPDKVCLATSKELQLKAGGGKTYKWVGPNGFNSNEQNPVLKNLTQDNSGEYQVLIDGKYPFSSNIVIGESSPPRLNYYITSQNTLYFYATDYDYPSDLKITGPNGFSSTNSNNEIKSLTPKNQGIYILETSDYYGCAQSANFAFKLKDTICYETVSLNILSNGLVANSYILTNQFNSWSSYNTTSLCDKSKISLEVDSTLASTGKLTWYKDGMAQKESKYTLEYFGEGKYHAIFEKGTCRYSGYPVQIKKNSTFNPYLQLFNQSNPSDTLFICQNGYGSLSIKIDANDYYVSGAIKNFEIYKDGLKVKENGNYMYYDNPEPGTFRVKAKYDDCTVFGKEIVIKNQEDIPLKIETSGVSFSENINFCKTFYSDGFYFGAEYPGYITLKKDGVIIRENSYSLYYYIKESGTYTLEYSSGSLCRGVKTFKVNATDKMTTNILVYSTNNNCLSRDYLLAPINLPDRDYYNIKWYTTINGVENYVGNNQSYYPSDNLNYYYKYESKGCSIVSNPNSVSNYGNNKIDFIEPSTVSICNGESYFLKLKNCGSNAIDWYKDGKFIETNYRCGLWVSESADYSFQLPFCGTPLSSKKVKVIPLPNPQVSIFCNGNTTGTIKLQDGISADKIEWFLENKYIETVGNAKTLSIDIPGKYMAKVTTNGCSDFSEPQVFGIVEDFSQVVCRGSTIKLSPTSKYASYEWKDPNGLISNSDSLIIKDFSPKNAGEYTVRLNSPNACEYTKKFKLFNSDLPDFELPSKIETCVGNNLMNFIQSKGLTESSEHGSYYFIVSGNNSNYTNYLTYDSPYLLSKNGNYRVQYGSSNSRTYFYNSKSYPAYCGTIKYTEVQLTNATCKKIVVPNITKMKICSGGEMKIPYDIIGETIKSDKDTWMWYKIISQNNSNIPQGFVDTTNANKIFPQNGVFTIPSFSLSSDSYQSVIFKIQNKDLTIAPLIQNINSNFGRRYLGYASMSKSCDGYEISLNEYNPKSYILDTMFIYKDNELFAKTTERKFITQTSGVYQVKSKYKNAFGNLYDGSLECLDQSSYSNLATKNYSISYLSQSTNAYCTDGNVGLKIYPNLENKPLEVKWYRNNIIMEDLNDRSEIKIKDNGEYIAKLKYEGCSESTKPITFEKESYGLNLNYTFNEHYLDVSNPKNKAIEVCPFASNNLNISNNYNERELEVQRFPKIKYEIYKDNAYLKGGEFDSLDIKVSIPQSGEYFVKTSTPFCSNLSSKFKIIHQKEISSTQVQDFSDCSGKEYTFFLYYPQKTITDANQLLDVEIFKNGQIFKKEKIASTMGVNYKSVLKESGKYYYKVNRQYEGGTCTYNSSLLNLKISDTLVLGKENKSAYICDVPQYLNFESSSSNFYNEINRALTDSWLKNGKAIPNTKGLYSYTTNESGTYKISTKTKEGCTIISPDYVVNSGKIKTELLSSFNNYNNQCDSSKSLYLYPAYFGSLKNYNNLEIEYFKDDKFIKKVNASNDNSNLIINSPGVYYANLKYPGCDSQTPKFDVKKIPEFPYFTPKGQVDICNGQAVSLKVNRSSTANVYWEKNGQLLIGQGDSLKISEPGKYAVFIKDTNCYYNSGIVDVKALNLSSATNLTGTVDFCPKDTIYLKAENMDQSVLYSLVRDNKKTISNYSGVFPINFKGVYAISQSKNNCQLTTESVVLVSKTDNELSLSDSSFCKGSNVSLSAALGQDYKYTWYKDGKVIENSKTNVLKISSEGKYTALISGKDCEAFSSEVYISEKPDLSATLTGDTLINYGDSANLLIKFTSSPPYNFVVNSEPLITTSLNPYQYTVSPKISSTYRISKVNNICGEGSSVGTVEVKVLVLSIGLENKIKIYPNPSSDFISFEGDLADIKEIVITSSNGKKLIVKDKNLGNDISVTNWSPGIYLIKLVFRDRVEEFKLLKL